LIQRSFQTMTQNTELFDSRSIYDLRLSTAKYDRLQLNGLDPAVLQRYPDTVAGRWTIPQPIHLRSTRIHDWPTIDYTIIYDHLRLLWLSTTKCSWSIGPSTLSRHWRRTLNSSKADSLRYLRSFTTERFWSSGQRESVECMKPGTATGRWSRQCCNCQTGIPSVQCCRFVCTPYTAVLYTSASQI